MNATITSIKETGTHKPLVTGSNPVAATNTPNLSATNNDLPSENCITELTFQFF